MKKYKIIQIRFTNLTFRKLFLFTIILSLFTIKFISLSAQQCSNSSAGYQVDQYLKPSGESFIPPIISLNLTALIEGLWNDTAMIPDTLECQIRNSSSPYNILDSARTMINNNGEGTFDFLNISAGNYWITIKHRNSIETWSSNPASLISGINNYDFSTSASQAFGSNMLLQGGRYCIYSGDVNQDGNIDLTDVVSINNDAGVISSGYLVTDLNGDNITDLTDLLIGFNNSSMFIAKITP